jgi:hypothetical protein
MNITLSDLFESGPGFLDALVSYHATTRIYWDRDALLSAQGFSTLLNLQNLTVQGTRAGTNG